MIYDIISHLSLMGIGALERSLRGEFKKET